MANVILAYPNKSDAATLSGGSWTLPLANLQTSVLTEYARTGDTLAASSWFDVNFGRSTPIRAIALGNHNLSVQAQIRVRASAVADFSTTAYDSGWMNVWPAVYDTADLEWEDDNFWSGMLTAEQLGSARPLWVHVMSSVAYGWYWRIEISDLVNGDGYIQAGRLFCAPAWQPANNMSYGAGQRWEPTYDVSTSLGGNRYFLPRANGRVMAFELEMLTTAEGFAYALDMQRQLGAHGELLVVGDPNDTSTIQQRSFIARLSSMGDVRIESYGRCSVPINLEEVL